MGSGLEPPIALPLVLEPLGKLPLHLVRGRAGVRVRVRVRAWVRVRGRVRARVLLHHGVEPVGGGHPLRCVGHRLFAADTVARRQQQDHLTL